MSNAFDYFSHVGTKLNKKQTDFVCYFLELVDNYPNDKENELRDRAYMKAYDILSYTENVSIAARSLLKKPKVADEVERLKALKYEHTKGIQEEIDKMRLKFIENRLMDEETQTEQCKKLWSKTDSVNKLVNIVFKCQMSLDSSKDVNPKVADTMRQTIESLNKMLGYNEPEKTAVDNTINVAWGNTNVAWGNTNQVLQPPVNSGELEEVSDDKVDAAIVMETAPVPEPTFDDYAG